VGPTAANCRTLRCSPLRRSVFHSRRNNRSLTSAQNISGERRSHLSDPGVAATDFVPRRLRTDGPLLVSNGSMKTWSPVSPWRVSAFAFTLLLPLAILSPAHQSPNNHSREPQTKQN
jgi:hypothetical protein